MDVFPAPSVEMMFTVPLLGTGFIVTFHVPLPSTTPVPIVVPLLSVIVIVLPISPLPVRFAFVGVTTVGTTGAVVSRTVKVND